MTKPARVITSWSPILLNGRHVSLSGEDQFGEHWVSTTLAELDVEARTATTISGRPYRMCGDPAPEYALVQAIRILSRQYDLEGSTIEPITLEEAANWLKGQPEKPSLPEKDKVLAEQHRRRQIWGWLRFQAVESGLTNDDVASVTGLPIAVIKSLHRGAEALGDVSTDEAEEGLGWLREYRGKGWRV